MIRPFVRIIIDYVRLTGLLLQLLYLHLYRVSLLIKYYALKAARAALVEAVTIEFGIKSMSMENRVIFATCIAVSFYVLALVMLIRF